MQILAVKPLKFSLHGAPRGRGRVPPRYRECRGASNIAKPPVSIIGAIVAFDRTGQTHRNASSV